MIQAATASTSANDAITPDVENMSWAFVEGDIREDQILSLRTALIRSQEARQQFLKIIQVHGDLVQMLGVASPTPRHA